jgi:hypothetical protein
VELLKTGGMTMKDIGGNAFSLFTPLLVLKIAREQRNILDAAAGKK